MEELRISELFLSLQGEASDAGWPTVFVRLTGCPLRCHYCDSRYAFSGGQRLSLEQITTSVADYGVRHVCITGGEPLSQKGVYPLMTQLADRGFHLSLETSGALSIEAVDPRVTIVLDVKTPDSGEVERNLESNLAYLKAGDQLKFVLGSLADYQWAKAWVESHPLPSTITVWFSPVYGQLDPRLLAEAILRDRLAVRLQLQLHKLLWGDVAGR